MDTKWTEMHLFFGGKHREDSVRNPLNLVEQHPKVPAEELHNARRRAHLRQALYLPRRRGERTADGVGEAKKRTMPLNKM